MVAVEKDEEATWELGQNQLLDYLEEIVYVSDVNTYELLYVNQAGKNLIPMSNYIGKKCYEVFQGISQPCPFCTNPDLTKDKMYTWEHDNAMLKRHFLIKDRLIEWDGRDCRLEIAVDITDREDVSRAVEQRLEIEQQLVRCIRILMQEDRLETAVSRVLSCVGTFYQADRAYIFECNEKKQEINNTYEWCAQNVEPQKDKLQHLDQTLVDFWMDLFSNEDVVIIEDLEAIKRERPDEYAVLKPQGVKSLMAVALHIDQEIVGFIGVDNPHVRMEDTTLLDSLAYFITTEMKNREMRVKLEYAGYHDSLTGLYNRTKFNEQSDFFADSGLSSAGIIFADINGLKQINDSYGHERGDALIINVGKTLLSVFERENVYRLGGDEFVVLYPNVDQKTFDQKLHRLLGLFDKQKESSVSFGYAFADHDINIQRLTNEADKQMYLKKQKYYEDQLSYSDDKGHDLSDQVRNHYRAMAYAKNIDDIVKDKGESKRQLFQYNTIIHQTYLSIYEINLDQNWIRSRYTADVDFFPFPPTNTLVQAIDFVGNRLLHPDDQEAFLQLVNITSLKRRFESRQDALEMECRILDLEGKYQWVRCTIMPIVYPKELNTGDMTLLVLLENIDARMNERLQQQDYERKHYLALRKLCRYICDIDVATGLFTVTVNGEKYQSTKKEKRYELVYEQMIRELVHLEDRESFAKHFHFHNMLKRFREGAQEISLDYRIKTDEGVYAWMRNMAVYLKGDRAHGDSILVIVKSVGEEKETEELKMNNMLLKQQVDHQKEMSFYDTRYRIIVEQTGAELFEWNKDETLFPVKGDKRRGGSIYISPKLMELFGYKGTGGVELAEHLLSKQMVHPDDVEAFQRFFFTQDPKTYRELICRVRPVGQKNYIWYKATITMLLDEDGNRERIVGTVVDVNQETRAKVALQERAEKDSITGIFNAETFYQKVDEKRNAEDGQSFAVIVMDIDKFKVVNDFYGIGGGNKVLKEIAQAIQKSIGEEDICARRYADVFLLCVDCDKEDQIKRLISRISKKISDLHLDVVLMPYFGICWVTDPSISVEQYAELASFAHKAVKEKTTGNWALYDDQMKKDVIEEKQMEREMQTALDEGQFHAYYQPKVDLKTGRLAGAEALVRWIHPEAGLIPPDRFIPLFERNGFIVSLDQEVWRQTCALIRKWLDEGKEPIPISVNVSRLHLLSSRLRSTLLDLTEEYQVPKKYLILELTESLFMENISYYEPILNELRKDGFLLAMDDFGSGYSSLNMLKDIPIDILKIDCGFLNETVASKRGKTIIQHIIAMVNDMSIRIVAEGVETKEQVEFLLKAGCPIGQGYYWSKPIPVRAFERLWENMH